MTPKEVVQIIRRVLATEAMGRISSTDADFFAKGRRFPQDPDFTQARLIQPYGLASRPPAQMESLISYVGGDTTHPLFVGQFDRNRPEVGSREVALYGPDGQVVYMATGGTIHQGSADAASPAVLGDVLADFLRDLLQAFLQASSTGESAVGPVFLSPELRIKFTELLDRYISEAETNILAQKIFLERGDDADP